MIDISVAAAKAHAAKLEFDGCGSAGIGRTRKEPVQFTDRQLRIVERFTLLVLPWQRRRAYRDAVEARLSGSVGDAAVTAACIAAAAGGFITDELLHEHGFVKFNSAGAVRPQHNERAKSSWSSNAITGAGRGR
jgi:hypothetical protein